MNRDALDEFFAKADDVLDNWHVGADAMLCEPSKGEVDLPRGDSYYDQRTQSQPLTRAETAAMIADHPVPTAGCPICDYLIALPSIRRRRR